MIESMAYGRLAQNPTVKKTANGGLMTVFDIASTREFGDKSGVDYARCLAFGRIGEYVAKYGAKGKGIIAMGEEQYPEYTDKNGNRQRGQQIIVSKVKFTSWDPVDGQDQNGQQPPQYRGNPQQNAPQQQTPAFHNSAPIHQDACRSGQQQSRNGFAPHGNGYPAPPKMNFMDIPEGVDDHPFN